MTEDLVVIGAGGHAKVVISTALAAGFNVVAALDDREDLWGREILGVPIVGPIPEAAKDFKLGVVGIGNNADRRRLSSVLDLDWATVVHPAATLDPTVIMGNGTVVFAGAVVQPGSQLGSHVIINTAASIDHDCNVGDCSHVAPGARLGGAVELETGVFAGIQSSIVPGCHIGAWATIGAGATVLSNLAPNVIAVGTPARPLPSRDAAAEGSWTEVPNNRRRSGMGDYYGDGPARAIAETHREYFDLVQLVSQLAEQTLGTPSPDQTSNRGILARALLARLFETTQAVSLLARHGLESDAGAALRISLEALFHLRACCTQEDFATQYDQDDTRRRLVLAAENLAHNSSLDKAVTSGLQEAVERLEGLGTSGRLQTIETIARDIGMIDEYEAIYRVLSPFVHSTGRALEEYAVVEDGDRISWELGPRDRQIRRNLTTATSFLWRGIGLTCNLLNLSDLHASHAQVGEGLKRLQLERQPDQR